MICNPENYTLYIDESGKSKLSDETGRYFLLSGVIIDNNLHEALSAYMVSLKEKCNIPTDENIHAFDLFENEKLKHGLSLKVSEINTFFNRLISLSHGVEMQLIILRIDKESYKKKIANCARKNNLSYKSLCKHIKREGVHDILYEAGIRKMTLEFGKFLENRSATGQIVAESRRNDDEPTLRAFVDSTQSSRFTDNSVYQKWSSSAFKNIHSLTFQNKKGLSFGLEIADMFAWAHFNNKWEMDRTYTDTKTRRIKKRLRQISDLKSAVEYKQKQESLTPKKIETLAEDRVSKLTNFLKNF
jgi:hypothetical protein